MTTLTAPDYSVVFSATEGYRNAQGEIVRIISLVGVPASGNAVSSPYFLHWLIEMDPRVEEPLDNSWLRVSLLPGLTWGDVDDPSDLVLSVEMPP